MGKLIWGPSKLWTDIAICVRSWCRICDATITYEIDCPNGHSFMEQDTMFRRISVIYLREVKS